MTTTVRYWHIAHPSYVGGDLQCRSNLGADAPTWAWDEAPEGFDGDVVCLFVDTPEGRQEADDLWSDRPTYTLLRVDLPATDADYDWDEAPLTVTTVEEGYPAVIGAIPARYITEIRRGYAEGAIGA